MLRGLLIPDTHVPYEGKAYDLMLKVAKDFKPHEVVIMGDFLDFYSISSHAREPDMPKLLEYEIKQGKKRLRELEKLFPRAKKVFVVGNHSRRLESFIRDRCPELFNLLSLTKILELEKWEVVPYGPQQKYRVLGSKLHVRHEPIGTTSKTTAARGMTSICYGHLHKIEESSIIALDGAEYVAFSPGWLGDKTNKAFSYVKNHAQWNLGFGIVYVDHKTRFFYHQIVRILENNTCVFNGKRYK